MAIIEPLACDIALDQLSGVDDFMFSALNMDRETVMEDFDDIYEDTLERCRETISGKGMFAGFPIEHVDPDAIFLENGTAIRSKVLPRYMQRAKELVLYAVAVHGYEELAQDPNNTPFDGMFFNAWGIGYAKACYRWVKEAMKERATRAGCHIGRGWAPGEGELEIELQGDLFHLLDPSRIGIERTAAGFMHPTMTLSGFLGISDDPLIESEGTDASDCH